MNIIDRLSTKHVRKIYLLVIYKISKHINYTNYNDSIICFIIDQDVSLNIILDEDSLLDTKMYHTKNVST